MSFNKNIFAEQLQSKNYDFCVSMLKREIIYILTKRIKEKCSDFEYTNISSLKQYCFKYLTETEKEVAVELFDLDLNEDNPASYILTRLLDLYNDLI